ncbi:unnamed protein product [Victoria cruziana]
MSGESRLHQCDLKQRLEDEGNIILGASVRALGMSRGRWWNDRAHERDSIDPSMAGKGRPMGDGIVDYAKLVGGDEAVKEVEWRG